MRTKTQSLQEYARGTVGGFLFSLPILYTMEVWWRGFIIPPHFQLIYLLVTFALFLGYNRFAGLREDASFKEVAIDSVEELGIGLVMAFVFLWLIGRMDFSEMPTDRIISMVLVEAMTVAIGVSVGTAQLSTPDEDESFGMKGDDTVSGSQDRNQTTLLAQLVLTVCAGILFAANIAPTEEVLYIAVSISPVKALLLVLIALLMAAIVLFFIDFRGSGSDKRKGKTSADKHRPTFRILTDTTMAYAVGLITSALALWFFGQLDDKSFAVGVFEVVVLAVPATVGASAGRLLLQ